MKVCTVVGARPQFIKAAAVSAKFAELRKECPELEEIIIHTGQHYDAGMSKIFFEELGIPHEKYNLEVGSGRHGEQTSKMLEKIEMVLIDEKPDWVLVYGDTNSTLAAALAAVKLNIRCAHIEAGMRSFNRVMPEEINRVLADHICEVNFCSSDTAVRNLENEGRKDSAVLVGDVMFDCSLKFGELAEKHYNPLEKFAIERKKYILMTCHRQENTDNHARLEGIVSAANELSKDNVIVFPIHPRTLKCLGLERLELSDRIRIIPPAGYLEMLALENNAALVLTDSGGVQKEAYFLGTACVTMRDETEWVETVELGWNRLAGASTGKIIEAVAEFAKNPPKREKSKPYGDGTASEKIIRHLIANQKK